MRERDFRKKVINFIIEQNKKCSPRAKLLSEAETKRLLKEEAKISKKANDLRIILNSGNFGSNTEDVHSLVEVLIDEKFPIEYKNEPAIGESENESIFENYDRKKKFSNYSLLECSDLNHNGNSICDESFYIKIGDKMHYSFVSNDYDTLDSDDEKYLEVATEDQVKDFVENENYCDLKTFFAFLNLE